LVAGMVLMIFGITPAKADFAPETYYSGNARSPYPPGCVTVPTRQLDLYGDNVALVHDGSIGL